MRSSRAALAAAVVCAGLAAYAALLASSASAQRPEGEAIELSGRKVRCDNVEIVMDRRLPSGGRRPRRPGPQPRMLNEQPAMVRLFVFHHECGHHHVGDSELKADCWAVERGVRDGWLDQRGLEEVCELLRGRAGDLIAPIRPAPLPQHRSVLRNGLGRAASENACRAQEQ